MQETIANYSINYNIGQGSFAKVYHAMHNLTGANVAIKIIPKYANNEDGKQMVRIQREIDIFKTVKHPFIAELFEVVETPENFYFVMEHGQKGTLLSAINRFGKFPEREAAFLFAQLIAAVKYLHQDCNVAHRDIKAENILLDAHNNIRVVDFGLSNYADKECLLHTQCGSPAYASPEMIVGKCYNFASDIWSCGIVLFAIVCGYLPFQDPNMTKLMQKIIYKEVDFPAHVSDECADLIKKLLIKDPEERITLNEIIEHPWIHHAYNTVTEKLQKFEYKQDVLNAFMEKIGFKSEAAIKEISLGHTNQMTVSYNILKREQMTYFLDWMTFQEPVHCNKQELQSATEPLPKLELLEQIKAGRRKSLNAQIIAPALIKMCRKHVKTVIYKI